MTMTAIDLHCDHQKLFVWNVRYRLIYVCASHVRASVCVFFYWPKQRVLSGAIYTTLRCWPVLASSVFRHCPLHSNHVLPLLLPLLLLVFTSTIFKEKKKNAFVATFYLFSIQYKLVRCCIIRLHAPITQNISTHFNVYDQMDTTNFSSYI